MGVFAVLEIIKFVAGWETQDGGSRGEVITVVVISNSLASVPLGMFIVSGKSFIDILISDWLRWSCKIHDGMWTVVMVFLRIRYCSV